MSVVHPVGPAPQAHGRRRLDHHRRRRVRVDRRSSVGRPLVRVQPPGPRELGGRGRSSTSSTATAGRGSTGRSCPWSSSPRARRVDAPACARRSAPRSRRSPTPSPARGRRTTPRTGDRVFVSKDGRTTFGVVWYPPARRRVRPGEAGARSRRARRPRTQTVDGAPVADHRDRRPHQRRRRVVDGPERARRDAHRRARRADRAGVRLRLADGVRAAADGRDRHPDHLPACSGRWPRSTEVSVVVQFLIALIGLGVAIDYSLLIVMRWREEMAAGREPEEAVARDDGARRAGRHLQRHRRRDRPAGPGRAAGAVPAQHRLRRPADPARQRAGGDHAAAGDPRHHRPAARPHRLRAAAPRAPARAGCRGAASSSGTAGSWAASRC